MKNKIYLLFFLLSYAYIPTKAQLYHDSPRREMRAVWLTTLSGLDWPKKKIRIASDTLKQQRELCAILDKLQQAHFNTIIFQTRIRATTAYPSAIEPWDGAFTNVAGRAPFYNPLRFAINECHKRGMELHAWVVAFPLGKATAMKALDKKSIVYKHPELCKKAGDDWMMDPGIPGTKRYIAAICAEITRNYDIDGIHLDYIRYPEHTIPFNDRNTYARYGKGKELNIWRRDNVTDVVTSIHDSVKNIKPWVKLSCSPVGKYSDLPRFSSKGWNALKAVHQDAALWLRTGKMDFVAPMMYFKGDDFYPFALQWNEVSDGQPIVPGLGAYMLATNERNWDFNIIQDELNLTRQERMGGQAYFRSKFVTDNVKGLYDYLKNYFYEKPALTLPVSSASPLPQSPQVNVKRKLGQMKLTWDNNPENQYKYNIYKCNIACLDLDSANILHLNYTTDSIVINTLSATSQQFCYAITSIDRYGRESLPTYTSVSIPKISKKQQWLTLPACDDKIIIIENAFGQTISAQKYASKIDISQLPNGFYTIRSINRKQRHRLTNFFVYAS